MYANLPPIPSEEMGYGECSIPSGLRESVNSFWTLDVASCGLVQQATYDALRREILNTKPQDAGADIVGLVGEQSEGEHEKIRPV